MIYWTRQSHSEFIKGKAASSLKNRDYKDFTDIVQEGKPMVYDGESITSPLNKQNPQPDGPSPTLNTDSRKYVSGKKYVLRRLTPIECLRLQGLPDNWCEGTNGSDSAVYKMAGNGLAIPCACDVLGRIAEEMRRDEP